MKREDIFAIITQHAREVVPELEHHAFRPDDRLADLGANSVDRAEIIMLTLESLSLQIPLVELSEARNIGGLADILFEKLNG
ncbi:MULTISPECIES: acyl carrier protein [Thermoactinomyces]|jgi:polyketide biosynthesis acyl carrier protein|uniref:Acyl carrier protein n=1 Tax=Thermoactinomyces daqus TaxID=1329516 RepID=A0A7W1XBH1_9BACL|nr:MULTISPECIES: acyl carrier protein [Thermoactinomyces]MBA4543503.1 acyl carrier protein [Thermoactinomyces daqus]MBH8598736.1 acyl carrier protein [Thermoactinomyces sp. CICC 10523]MBH8605512.1 acyl carrier protein [Thermoactinomyces sp. CICC 10522]MBH8608800.1 acyl carrier protein [Thermoactinomyces sp. CICC 10521]